MTAQRPQRKFRYIMGTLAVVAAVSGGAAYAASRDDSPQARNQAILNDAAGTLGVAPGKLSDALKKALENQVDAQVTAGTLTQERADAIKKRIEDGTLPIFGGPGFGGPRGHFGGPRGHFGGHGRGDRGPGFGFGFGFGVRGPALMAGIEDVATYLGLKSADIAAQLRSGKSLADIAKAQGKTVAGLKTAITDAATKQLDAAVTAGKLTKDEETKILAGLASHLDDLVNDVHRFRGFGDRHDHDGWMPGGPDGDDGGGWAPAPTPASPATPGTPATPATPPPAAPASDTAPAPATA
jgi:phage-related minor tail protein